MDITPNDAGQELYNGNGIKIVGKNVIVQADNMSISDITIMSSELEQNSIESVDDIELSFKIVDENFTDIAITDPISFSAK